MTVLLSYIPPVALCLAGIVHMLIAPEHFSHTPAHGLFFGMVGAAQFLWSLVSVWTKNRPNKYLYLSGLMLSGGIAVLWMLTHYVSMPFAAEIHPLNATSAATKFAELTAFIVLFYRSPFPARSRTRIPLQRRMMTHPLVVSTFSGFAVWGVTMLVAPLLPGLAETPHMEPTTFTEIRTSSAYFSITSRTADALVSITAPDVGTVTLHRIPSDPVEPEGIPLTPHARVDFSPAGRYIGLSGLRFHLFKGSVITLTLNFASGRQIPVEFQVLEMVPEGRLNFVSVEEFQITNAWVEATASFDGLVSNQSSYDWQLPQGFPMPRVPDNNPMTAEKVELGRHLFYDTKLSGNNTYSCSTCHLQALAFTDGQPLAVGSTGDLHPRNSMSLTNIAYNTTLTWANPNLLVLERQIPIPMFGEHPVEMGITGHEDEILERFRQEPLYQEMFAEAYPDEDDLITFNNITLALSSFTRTLISGSSPYDRYLQGDTAAISDSAKRGMDMFFSEGLECHHCHTGFNFTLSTVTANTIFEDRPFFNTGLYNIGGTGAYPSNNTGVFEITNNPSDMGRFRPPTLRNISLTAPYMHDGSLATLDDVIQFYSDGGHTISEGEYAGDGRANPYKSGLVPGFTLSDEEVSDLIAFLQSLTDESFITDPRFSDPFAQTTEATLGGG